MKQNFTFSRFVLSELYYTDNEIKQIIETLQRGDFAYVEKKEYPTIRDNDIWRKDNVSGIDVPVLWTPDAGITNETILLLAQDPLRDADYWDEAFCHDFTCTKENRNKYVVVGTPYALHYFPDGNFKATQLSNGKKKSWRVKIYYDLIRSIVERGYNVYCTDIFKYYFHSHKYEVCDFDKKILGDFNYRFGKTEDFAQIFYLMKELYEKDGGLSELFKYAYGEVKTLRDTRFFKTVTDYFYSRVAEDTAGQGFYFMIPNPENGGAMKRMNMFLRWMVRKPPVDFGIWNFIPQSELLIPLDVHVARVSREMGLLSRSSNDFKAVIELTDNLKNFDANDPVKYDFATFGYGVNR